jgi:hypothetical protein
MITPVELCIAVGYSTAAGIALGAELWPFAVCLVALQVAFVTKTLTT